MNNSSSATQIQLKRKDTFFKTPKGDDCEICCNCNKAAGNTKPHICSQLSNTGHETCAISDSLLNSSGTFVTFTHAHPKRFRGMPTRIRSALMATAKLSDRTVGIGKKEKISVFIEIIYVICKQSSETTA